LPSIDEPFPMSVLEAASLGLPVIVTNTCGLAEPIIESDAGIVVDESMKGLVGGIRSLLADEGARDRAGTGARIMASTRFGMDAVAGSLETAYSESSDESTRAEGPLLIVESNMSGHRFNYVRILADNAQIRQIPTVLLTNPEGWDAFTTKAEGRHGLEVVTVDGSPSIGQIERAARQLNATRVAIPGGDKVALAVALSGGWRSRAELRVLAIREFGQGESRPVVAAIKSSVRKTLFALANLHSRVKVAVLVSSISPTCGRLPRVADPIEFMPSDDEIQSLRARHGLDPATTWFVIAGRIDSRKNVSLVMAALDRVAAAHEAPLGLLLAGSQSSEVRDDISEQGKGRTFRLVEVDRQLTPVELDSCIQIADIVVLAHTNDGPSGILGKAVAGNRRVLAAGSAQLRRDVKVLGRAGAWSALNVDDISVAMREILNASGMTELRPAGVEDFSEYFMGRTD